MTRRMIKTTLITIVALVGAISAALWTDSRDTMNSIRTAHDGATNDDPRIIALRKIVERQTFEAMPEARQRRILAAAQAQNSVLKRMAQVDQTAFANVSDLISLDAFSKLAPIHQTLLSKVRTATKVNGPTGALCFAPGADPELIAAFELAIFGDPSQRFQQTSRWSSTATDGGGLTQGDPTTLTYSFVPDGTFVPNLFGFSGNSDLFAFLDGIYGNTATWQAVYAQVFARWDELSGVTYVLEPNDDGVQLDTNTGIVGVRGDLRMAGIFIDGNGGPQGSILAYNNFPNDGDMVIDTGDSFYSNLSGQSLGLRNVIAHEHGHGSGQLHVCPVNQTKLMEPFISFAFDGPQIDDIQNIQRHYGDDLEHNDTSATASPLGALGDGTITVTDISSDDNGDVDYYSFSTIAPDRGVTATMRPIGSTYLNGPQNGDGSCSPGSNFNSLIANNLGIEVLDSDGTTVLASATTNGAGINEIAIAALPAVDTYFIRVLPGTSNTIQLYELDVTIGGAPFDNLTIAYAPAAPTQLTPNTVTQFMVDIDPGDDTLVPASETLHYRFDGGSFITAPLTPLGGTSYMAALPAAGCGDSPEFFVSAEGQTGGVRNNPSGGAADPIQAATSSAGGTPFSDDFESDLGWTVADFAESGTVDGTWERGVPVGGGDRGDPASCFGGSGQCYLTDNVDGNSDVDNGATVLTSPVFDLSDGGTISYAYWLNDIPGGPIGAEDSLSVEVATNAAGTNWVELRLYDTVAANWRTDSIEVGVETPLSSTVRIRFAASDFSPGDVIEAGIDNVVVSPVILCADLEDCMFGPDAAPAPTAPITAQQCLDAYDFDADGDVDLIDGQMLQDLP